MFQDFTVRSRPEEVAPRLARLREVLAASGLDGVIIPRADRFQGETVAPADERLAWSTGFTGSAGQAAVLGARAVLFVDGRYTLQARAETDTELVELRNIPRDRMADWLKEALPQGGRVGFDPWLFTRSQIVTLREGVEGSGISLEPVAANPVDLAWEDRPAPPLGAVRVHPVEIAGLGHAEKRASIAQGLRKDGIGAAVLGLPESIAWLLNIRGSDISRTPVPHGFAVIRDDARVDLFIEREKIGPEVAAHLGNEVAIEDPAGFLAALGKLKGKVALDAGSVPFAAAEAVANPVWQRDPCLAPKARKTGAELDGMRAAHRRDAVAMCRFLAWLDQEAPKGGLTEISVVKRLEAFRHETGALRDISFETIAGAGPHGAIVHYRVNEATDRAVNPGEMLLVDSGAQYDDGTTDITRTIPIGSAPQESRTPYTLVLKGMIALSRLRFPKGLSGRDIDALARAGLWNAGLDYDHGTGHGVGAGLGVHEGPQSISRRSTVALEAGMIVSNEPGYYREGAFGIRIENLVAVQALEPLAGGDPAREWLGFETLTLVPIDRRAILPELLSRAELEWLDSYHTRVLREIGPLLDAEDRAWLNHATRPLGTGVA